MFKSIEAVRIPYVGSLSCQSPQSGDFSEIVDRIQHHEFELQISDLAGTGCCHWRAKGCMPSIGLSRLDPVIQRMRDSGQGLLKDSRRATPNFSRYAVTNNFITSHFMNECRFF